jgi:hypothetical protein
MLQRRRLDIAAWATRIGVAGQNSLSRGDGVDLDSRGSRTARVTAVVDTADGAEWRRVRGREMLDGESMAANSERETRSCTARCVAGGAVNCAAPA